MSSGSVSEQLRQKGNNIYRSITDGLAPVLKKSRLVAALAKYNEAHSHAQNAEEKASASKNIAKASFKLVSFLPVQTEHEIELVRYHAKNAIDSYSQSYVLGQTVKPSTWLQDLVACLQDCWVDLIDIAESIPFQRRVSLLEECVYSVGIESLRGQYWLQIAEIMFHESVHKLNEKDFRQSLSIIHSCYRPVEEAVKSKRHNPAIMSDVNVMREDLRFHICTVESLQAMSIGDDLLEKYCKKDGAVDMTMAWEVLDWYKKAALATREIEVEMEAIALSRIGKLYDEVFAIKSKARENFKRAIELAISMHPRTFNNEDWYKVCTETLEKYQKEQVKKEDEIWNTARQKYLKELEAELKEIDSHAKKGDITLVKFVYKTHPPKQKGNTLPEKLPDISEGIAEYNADMKTLLKKAIVHYHPDRCDVKADGEKWKVLSEEICMRLTRRYESFK
ncbi:uncharacterized protein LOC135682566 [Rhopilema esculentum]|uniref:uncharacterized protein LOC135682566 n=1 Tax=Rhopilema esculentum TaxID=499914 RepID=UPI0031E1BA02|eukprot:gene13913-4865_t